MIRLFDQQIRLKQPLKNEGNNKLCKPFMQKNYVNPLIKKLCKPIKHKNYANLLSTKTTQTY
jgi:hypothetical protein